MARLPRLDLPNVPQHIVQRGNDRQPCFAGLADYQNYRQELYEAAHKHGCAVHAYVLMTNHVHLLVTPQAAGGASRMMQALGRRYVGAFNARYGRTGTLWEGRFKSALVDLTVAKLAPIGTEMRRLQANHDYIDSVLRDGATRARERAAKTMMAVRDIVGFVR